MISLFSSFRSLHLMMESTVTKYIITTTYDNRLILPTTHSSYHTVYIQQQPIALDHQIPRQWCHAHQDNSCKATESDTVHAKITTTEWRTRSQLHSHQIEFHHRDQQPKVEFLHPNRHQHTKSTDESFCHLVITPSNGTVEWNSRSVILMTPAHVVKIVEVNRKPGKQSGEEEMHQKSHCFACSLNTPASHMVDQ